VSATLNTKEIRAIKKKKLDMLKKFLNDRKILLTSNESIKQIEKIPYISIEQAPVGAPKFHVSKLNGTRVPDYLKEDFPSKSVHQARVHMQKMNEGMPVSPTAQEFHLILDNFTAIKGIPRGAFNYGTTVKKRLNKNGST
jgi:hypothetical protein